MTTTATLTTTETTTEKGTGIRILHKRFSLHVLTASTIIFRFVAVICPDGFPYFETNTISVHGDVCRNEIWHGFGVGWTCPIGCVGANSAPWCMQSSSDNSPCRAGKLLFLINLFCETGLIHSFRAN